MSPVLVDELFLGLDIGTSSMKGILVGGSGAVAWRGTESYGVQSLGAGRAEQRPEDWLAALSRMMAGVPNDLKVRIAAIGADGHVPSLVAVDAQGNALRPCLLWQDVRAQPQADSLGSLLPDPMELFGTTIPWSGSHLPAKAAWLMEAEPEVAARTAFLMQPKDFLNFSLTGVAMSDGWGSKGLVHVGSGRPVQRVLEAAGWHGDVVPPVGAPWEVQSGLSGEAANRLGLRAGTPVVVGWTDALSSVLAVGGFDTPSSVVLAGTSEIVGTSGSDPKEADGLYLVPETVSPRGLSYGPTQMSGGALLWISGVLGLEPLEALDLAVGAGTGPTFVPYLMGERAPLWDPEVRGLFLGLGAEHGGGELVRAVLDGVAFSARHVLSRSVAATGTQLEIVNVSGRGVDHPAWLSARGSGLGVPLRLHLEPNLAALGAAMLAAMGTGHSLGSLDSLRSQTRFYEPSPEELERGHRGFELFLEASRISQEWSRT